MFERVEFTFTKGKEVREGRALGIYEKSENFNSHRPMLFELCKKTTGGGEVKLTPSQQEKG